jgi:ribosome-binding protein aMBF1 (putative translation factor)
MNASKKTLEIVQVSCEICLREVPTSEVQIEEADCYVMYFCGLDCYRQWREKAERENNPAA